MQGKREIWRIGRIRSQALSTREAVLSHVNQMPQ